VLWMLTNHSLTLDYWNLVTRAGLSPRGAPCQIFRGTFLSLPFSHPVFHPFFWVFVISYKITNKSIYFSVLNLILTTCIYSKKLIAAIIGLVLHTLPALCSCKRVNNVNKWYIVKQEKKRLEEDGSRHCGFQMTGYDDKKPGRSTCNNK